MSTPTPKIHLSKNALKLCCNLQRADYAAFQQSCSELARSTAVSVTMDLTQCTYVSSLVIGILVDTVTQMKADGKAVKVRVSPEVGRFLHMAHLYHLFSYEIIEPHIEAR
jgi:anti-anti-sigma factor